MAIDRIDWRMVFMLPPKRRFTAQDLRRAQISGMSRTLIVSAGVNVALPVLSVIASTITRTPWTFTLTLLLLTASHALGAVVAWADPSSRAARLAYFGLPLTTALSGGFMLADKSMPLKFVTGYLLVAILASMTLCLANLHRHHYIEQRLREADERDKAVEMAQRLAGAQLEPHFLFNTLASAQHWVNTKDDRAAPLLQALTGYLRATLPMFKTALLPARDELLAVRRYLEVMQVRLGTRLRFDIHTNPTAEAALLPPGVLLTLVENAVAHGIEPQISGGHISLQATADGTHAVFSISDNGPGLPSQLNEGVGLSNARQRLQLTCGTQAQLTLTHTTNGGCRAELHIPLKAPA
jgi:signal transduction histidine kinase